MRGDYAEQIRYFKTIINNKRPVTDILSLTIIIVNHVMQKYLTEQTKKHFMTSLVFSLYGLEASRFRFVFNRIFIDSKITMTVLLVNLFLIQTSPTRNNKQERSVLLRSNHNHRSFSSYSTSCSLISGKASKRHLQMVGPFRSFVRTLRMHELFFLHRRSVHALHKWLPSWVWEPHSVFFLRTSFSNVNYCMFDILQKQADICAPLITIKRLEPPFEATFL